MKRRPAGLAAVGLRPSYTRPAGQKSDTLGVSVLSRCFFKPVFIFNCC